MLNHSNFKQRFTGELALSEVEEEPHVCAYRFIFCIVWTLLLL